MIAHIASDQHRFRLSVASLSAPGARASNEDYLGMIDMGTRGCCLALADGAGGHGNGALAARLTVDAVLEGYRDNPLFAPAGLASLISRAEHTVSAEQPASVSRQHMCATVVLLCIEPTTGRALWAHWGDSRLYCFRADKVHRMTEDHSLVQQLLHAGIYQKDDLRQLPNRSVLSGAIGAHSQVPPTVLGEAIALEAGDAFLLCSDGLWENLQEADMEAALSAADRPDAWLQQMVASVLAAGKPNQDNLSAHALWVTLEDNPT
ncbi:MAG: serine/threonine-protein phosphatase [Rhodoferax sp.]|nr:serine/threonine-protein phosphatase [Rhodoferax sp.]